MLSKVHEKMHVLPKTLDQHAIQRVPNTHLSEIKHRAKVKPSHVRFQRVRGVMNTVVP
jgi:hypothetical protein